MEIETSYSHLLLPLSLIIFFGTAWDIRLLGICLVRKKWDEIQPFIAQKPDLATVLKSFLLAASVFVSIKAIGYIRGLKQVSSAVDIFPVKPLFFPCETKHVRMFPAKHGFIYSYLLTGIPVGFRGAMGGMISVDEGRENPSWCSKLFKPWTPWFMINSDDYLGRGHDPDGLPGKLRKYLRSDSIDHGEYAHAYLFTAARFLDYASNPVSIWFLYTQTKELSAIILEVNNTFGERHSYFLEPDFNAAGKAVETWPKDFYVSVFNSRAGNYSLVCSDPFSPNMSEAGQINTTITLSDASGKAMLIARLYSAGDAVDPSSMSVCQKTRFILRWWWVGLATFPRTVVEAFNLLFRKGMPWVFRPEPRKATMPREADETESCIEACFRAFLYHKMLHPENHFTLRYISAGFVGLAENMVEFKPPNEDSEDVNVEIRVLTPLFYSRLTQYTNTADAFYSEISSGTVSISNPEVLEDWDGKNSMPDAAPDDFGHRTDGADAYDKSIGASSEPVSFSSSPFGSRSKPFDTLIFWLIVLLRKRPSIIPCLKDETPPSLSSKRKPSERGASPLDAFVLTHLSGSQRREYASKVLRLMLAGRLAFGWIELLDLEFFAFKAAVIWWVVRKVV